jgi:hypothetical protein
MLLSAVKWIGGTGICGVPSGCFNQLRRNWLARRVVGDTPPGKSVRRTQARNSARAQGAPSGKVATYPRQIADRLARRIATIASVDAIEVKSECLCA